MNVGPPERTDEALGSLSVTEYEVYLSLINRSVVYSMTESRIITIIRHAH